MQETIIKVIGYIATANTIISVWATGHKDINIWLLSMVNQCLWFYVGYTTHQNYIIVMAIALQILNIRGYRMWRNNG